MCVREARLSQYYYQHCFHVDLKTHSIYLVDDETHAVGGGGLINVYLCLLFLYYWL